MLAAMWQLNGR